jgi:glycosyltransferase involved in cell wall biosynthesis
VNRCPENTLKLLYIGHTYSIRANQAKIAQLARLDSVELTLITPDNWRGPLYNNVADPFEANFSEAVIHHRLPVVFAGREGAYFYRKKLFSIIAELQPDIVHVEQGAHAMSYAQTILALKRFSPHSKATFFTWWNLPYTLSGLRAKIEPFNLKHSACAVTGNEAARSILVCRGFDKPMRVIPQLGVDLNDYPNVTYSKSSHEKFVIGYVGRVTKEKGVLDLVEAIGVAAEKSRMILAVVGGGSALEALKFRAVELGVALEIHPSVRNEEVPAHLKKLDTLVLPSLSTEEWVEQFGHILLEAMAAGVPVIGSSSGEIPNVIGLGGRIYPEGNIEALSSLLDAFSTHDRVCEELSRKGRERVENEFTHARIAEKQFSLYEWMMAHGKSVAELSMASPFRRMEVVQQ